MLPFLKILLYFPKCLIIHKSELMGLELISLASEIILSFQNNFELSWLRSKFFQSIVFSPRITPEDHALSAISE